MISHTFFSFLLLTLLLSCSNPQDNKTISSPSTDSAHILTIDEKQEILYEKRRVMREEEIKDSIFCDRALIEALIIAQENIHQKTFHTEFDVVLDSNFNVKVELSLGHHFSKTYQHLIVRRYAPNNFHLDIYVKKDTIFEKVLSEKQWKMCFINDTIQDINGDGFKDVVIVWSALGGCCLGESNNIYLLENNKYTFSDMFKFFNPTFSPKEKIIRGVGYGHPGETEMYKYKWNGNKIDTMEYVYFERNDTYELTGKIIVSNRLPYDENFKVIKKLDEVPAEYKKIYGYDWFNNDL